MLFGSSKTKNLNKLFASKAQVASTAQTADMIMSRNTFNEKDLIKKKEEPVQVVVEEKKKSPLEESDDEDDFFKKKKKKEAKMPQLPGLPVVPKVAPVAAPVK
jgi:hypothetical protein